jgi:anti-anti-sigma factor
MQPHEPEAEIPVLKMRGTMDVESVRPFTAEVGQVLGTGRADLVIDMSELLSLSGGAMGALLVLECEAERRGGTIKLARVPEPIERALRANGLTEVFASFERAEDAVRSFAVNRRRLALG